MVVQVVSRKQQQEWGLLEVETHALPAPPTLAEDVGVAAQTWVDQAQRVEDMGTGAIKIARLLHANAGKVAVDFEASLSDVAHEIPTVHTMEGNLNVLVGTDADGSDADAYENVDDDNNDVVHDVPNAEDAIDYEMPSMYERINVLMLPLVQAELNSVSVVAMIVAFNTGLRKKVLGKPMPPVDVEAGEYPHNIMKYLGCGPIEI